MNTNKNYTVKFEGDIFQRSGDNSMCVFKTTRTNYDIIKYYCARPEYVDDDEMLENFSGIVFGDGTYANDIFDIIGVLCERVDAMSFTNEMLNDDFYEYVYFALVVNEDSSRHGRVLYACDIKYMLKPGLLLTIPSTTDDTDENYDYWEYFWIIFDKNKNVTCLSMDQSYTDDGDWSSFYKIIDGTIFIPCENVFDSKSTELKCATSISCIENTSPVSIGFRMNTPLYIENVKKFEVIGGSYININNYLFDALNCEYVIDDREKFYIDDSYNMYLLSDGVTLWVDTDHEMQYKIKRYGNMNGKAFVEYHTIYDDYDDIE